MSAKRLLVAQIMVSSHQLIPELSILRCLHENQFDLRNFVQRFMDNRSLGALLSQNHRFGIRLVRPLLGAQRNKTQRLKFFQKRCSHNVEANSLRLKPENMRMVSTTLTSCFRVNRLPLNVVDSNASIVAR